MTTDDVLEGTDPMKAKEWNELEITFTWKAGEAALNTGSVTVSYHPVTDDVTKRPRFASGPTNDVIEIERLHHDAAVPLRGQPRKASIPDWSITNASEGKGYCTIGYSGPDAPADMMTPEQVEGGRQWIDLLSTIAAGFPGLYHCNL